MLDILMKLIYLCMKQDLCIVLCPGVSAKHAMERISTPIAGGKRGEAEHKAEHKGNRI